jgi:hypothetical protein
MKEFRGLERRRGSSGRDRVDHRPGSHPDLCNAAAGCLVGVAARQRKGKGFFFVSSYTKSTDGFVYIGREQVAAGSRAWRDEGQWVHPHERIEPVGPSEMSERKRQVWGSV